MPPTDPHNQKTQKGPVKEPDTDESVVADGPAVRLHQFDHTRLVMNERASQPGQRYAFHQDDDGDREDCELVVSPLASGQL